MRVVLSLLLIAIAESASNELGRWSIIGIYSIISLIFLRCKGQTDIVCIHTALLPDMRLVCVERPHEFPVILYRGFEAPSFFYLISDLY